MNDPIKKALHESVEGNELSDRDAAWIYAIFKKSIVLPAFKPKKQVILAPVGLVGAGKSTVVIPLSEKLSLVRVSNDELRKLLQFHGFNYVRTRELTRRLIREFLKEGYSICIDSDSIDAIAEEEIRTCCQIFSATAIWIHINPPEAFIIHKLTHYKHTWLFRDAEHALKVMNVRKLLHEEYLPHKKFYYVFDTSQDIVAQIEGFMKKFAITIEEEKTPFQKALEIIQSNDFSKIERPDLDLFCEE